MNSSTGIPLTELFNSAKFIGWTYAVDYDNAFVMTNDLWKAEANGIPHNSFLFASAFSTDQEFKGDEEVILLRVVRAAKLPQDDDLVRTKIDFYQQQRSSEIDQENDFDDITLNLLQFGGLECRVLGTFYFHDDELWLGSDIESFTSSSRLSVYRPVGKAVEDIVNYVDPIRRAASLADQEALGVKGEIKPFRIGSVRYTSTDRLHRKAANAEEVPVSIQPSDFLARRTAVLGMTRTGKSNMIKQLVAVVKRVSDEGGIKIGQLIYDLNGEYANANQQDEGALGDIYVDDTVRYRMVDTPGFMELRTNFYVQLNEGFSIIQQELAAAGRVTADYVRAFVNQSFDEPPEEERGTHNRWKVRVAAYQTILHLAQFKPPNNFSVQFSASQAVRTRVNEEAGQQLPDPSRGLSLQQAEVWFRAAQAANEENPLPSAGAGGQWVDDTLQVLLNMIAQKRGSGAFISGYRILADIPKYHSPKRVTDVAEEIYGHLVKGNIVILDMSVGNAQIRENISKQIAEKIFFNSMDYFINGNTPPNVAIYVEEAHNLVGKGMDLTETWPRLAKEGAKYRISLIYATQEVTSMHPNILANTENWFVTHLNNAREIRELAQFYDFDDFSRSLLRAQDVGFARVKTLSGPFVIPTQIDKFDPKREMDRIAKSK